MSDYSTYLSERRKWAGKGVGGTISKVSLLAGATLAIVILVWPEWFYEHVPEQMSRFLTALIPLCAGCSVFAVRWLISPYYLCRDLKQQIKGKPNREILKKLISQLSYGGPNFAPYQRPMIVRLISMSDEFGDESDVEETCKNLEQSGRPDPFGFFDLQYGKSLRGKKLKFLRDAHIASFPMETDSDVSNYMQTVWADKNGLIEVPVAVALATEAGQRASRPFN